MIVMAMGNRNGVNMQVFDLVEHGHAFPAHQFRVDAGIEQDAKSLHFHHPSAGADALRWIQIRNVHAGSLKIDRSNANAIRDFLRWKGVMKSQALLSAPLRPWALFWWQQVGHQEREVRSPEQI